MACELSSLRPGQARGSGPGVIALLAISLVGSLASHSAARAHAIESSLVRLQALRDTLQLDARFSTGIPVQGALVRLVAPDGREILSLGRTDQGGALRFQLPATASSDWEVQVDGGGGHRDYLELPLAVSRAPQARSAERVGERPWGLLALGMVSGGLVWIRRPR